MNSNFGSKNLKGLQNNYENGLFQKYTTHVMEAYNFQNVTESIGKYAEIQSDMRVLDIGIGNGLSCYYACKIKSDVYEIDFCRSALDNFSLIANKFNNKNAAIMGDALSLPFKDNSFDRVIAYYIFHHMPTEVHRNQFINEMKRVTVPRGLIIMGKIRCNVFWLKPKEYEYIRYLSIKSIKNMASLNNLEIVNISHSKAQKFPKLFNHLPIKYFGHAIDVKLKVL